MFGIQGADIANNREDPTVKKFNKVVVFSESDGHFGRVGIVDVPEIS